MLRLVPALVALAALHAVAAEISATNAAIAVQDDSGAKSAAGTVFVVVDPASVKGPVKPMNAVNNGPSLRGRGAPRQESRIGRFVAYRNARFPMARFHDASWLPPGHVCDINCVFPDSEADENDPASYDFTLTDWLLDSTRRAGTEIFYRLGNNAEPSLKSYGNADPPADPLKWARIAEHIIRHYNEGWGWTNEKVPFENQFRIRYWEIWNEADLGCPSSYWTKPTEYWRGKPRFWNGSPERFFAFYATVAKYLKSVFPDLKIGGPAAAGNHAWCDKFLAHCRAQDVPLDFFSWHVYADTVEAVVRKGDAMKRLLDKHGYGGAESILNEWNWNLGWYGAAFRASAAARTEANNSHTAAFCASVMCAMQDSPAAMLMYYDARVPTHYNGIFSYPMQRPLKGWYAFYAWSKLRDMGTQVAAECRGAAEAGVRAVAAKGRSGAVALFVARYLKSPVAQDSRAVRISVRGRSMSAARCHLTDEFSQYTETPFELLPDGSAEIDLEPDSFALFEIDP